MKRSDILIAIVLMAVTSVVSGVEIWAQDVIVHSGVSRKEISRNTLRAIFGMRLRKWSDGTPITVFVLKDDSPTHIEFSKTVLHVFPYQLRRGWDRQVFSGTGQSPQKVNSLDEMRNKVATTPGAIGYSPKEGVHENLGVLKVR
ncbi:MAG: substrate-binding domain-containing protein [Nitrospiria bacterium]